jgi:molybdate transport system ATP-binding protein
MLVEARVRHRFPGFALDVEVASDGPVLGVFGPSGSGKTTLLLALAGGLRPHEGRIAISGRELCRRPGGPCLPPEERRLGVVLQDALLFPNRSVRGNLGYAAGAAERLEAPEGRRILEVLRLRPLLDRGVAHLSGGELQRVALGRALLAAPELLLLDEPTSSLDAELARDVLALLLQVKRELAVPMVFVTHKAGELLALADDCAVLEGGRVVAQGAPIQVLQRPRALGVARLLGVDNLLRLLVLRHDAKGGVTLLDLAPGQALAAPLCSAEPGTLVTVGFYADEVLLCLERPVGLSARNALAGVVTHLDEVGHEVLVEIQVGSQSLRARVTRAAAAELRLAWGVRAVAVVKTAAIHLLGEADD